MRDRRPLIVVSNRGPVTYDRDEHGARIERRGGGGLVTALRGLREEHDVTWIASASTDEDRVVAAEAAAATDVVLVAHDPRAYDAYYNVIANPLLWFVQHSLWALADTPVIDRTTHAAWRDGYVRVNAAFAEAVVAELDNRPEAIVFFHDYHLYLAPRLVRNARPDALLAHFVHIPWPADLSALPPVFRDAILDGLLANDVVGFHTERWARNFVATCGDVGSTAVTHHAIAVDPREFDSLAAGDAVREQEARISRGEKLIVRVDRTDPSKNIVRGFRAFELFLAEHPEWHRRVSMLALLDPSRQAVPEYAAYLAQIEQAVADVNGRFRAGDWLPVDLQVADNFPQSVAAYKQYDVLLVNPVFDGLNLVAKEGPLVNTRDGVLVLSENAGAHEELAPWASSVNPFDVVGQADAIHAALTMPEPERRRRATGLRAHVRAHDVAAWTEAQLADFDAALARRRSRNVRP
jgi:trehalose 6-phosphate synthase